MGRCLLRPGAIVVHAYEKGRVIPSGKFYGYINGAEVKLYPMDFATKCAYRGKDKLDITIYDLKARDTVCI